MKGLSLRHGQGSIIQARREAVLYRMARIIEKVRSAVLVRHEICIGWGV
jgi:hypothetical protein